MLRGHGSVRIEDQLACSIRYSVSSASRIVILRLLEIGWRNVLIGLNRSAVSLLGAPA